MNDQASVETISNSNNFAVNLLTIKSEVVYEC